MDSAYDDDDEDDETPDFEMTWKHLDEPGADHAQLWLGDKVGHNVEGWIEGEGYSFHYMLHTDIDWNSRILRITRSDSDEYLGLTTIGKGPWGHLDGRSCPELQGATDFDLTSTPLTNSLPIRRLRLAVGESAEILAAYVVVPALTFGVEPQRYTRLSEFVYRFEAIDPGYEFTRDITVDENGFVLDYPGMFVRS